MIYINHCVNTVEQLKHIPIQNGVELDIRYHKDDLILHHDPFCHHLNKLQKFEDYLKQWRHEGPMILNIKTEGIEKACIELMNNYQIKNWFFLDLSMPVFVSYTNYVSAHDKGKFFPENMAVRFSEYEPIEYALSFAGKVGWVWIDCFTYLPLEKFVYKQLKDRGFKICLVSPELQKHSLMRIKDFKKQCEGLDIDAVCTKRPDLWGQSLQKETMIK